jgi:hypothetical protein
MFTTRARSIWVVAGLAMAGSTGQTHAALLTTSLTHAGSAGVSAHGLHQDRYFGPAAGSVEVADANRRAGAATSFDPGSLSATASYATNAAGLPDPLRISEHLSGTSWIQWEFRVDPGLPGDVLFSLDAAGLGSIDLVGDPAGPSYAVAGATVRLTTGALLDQVLFERSTTSASYGTTPGLFWTSAAFTLTPGAAYRLWLSASATTLQYWPQSRGGEAYAGVRYTAVALPGRDPEPPPGGGGDPPPVPVPEPAGLPLLLLGLGLLGLNRGLRGGLRAVDLSGRG